MPNANQFRRALERAGLLVVQDCYHPTETTRLAHVLLPAAKSLEVEGAMTNSERRVSLIPPFSRDRAKPPSRRRSTWRGSRSRKGTSGMWIETERQWPMARLQEKARL